MQVQTVLGPIDVAELGRTLFHEHLFLMFPGAEFDSTVGYDRAAAIDMATERLIELREEHRVTAFVDPCPIEMGRDVEAMALVSQRSGVHVVGTTGFYHEPVGLPSYWRDLSAEKIAEFYILELQRGVQQTGIRAGALKCATGAPEISETERKFLKAAGMAQRETGVVIITHTTSACCGTEQQQILEDAGADIQRVVIGHCCESSDANYHRRIVEGGSFIGFDRIGWLHLQSDENRADALARLIRDGRAGSVLISQDRYTALGGRYGWSKPKQGVPRQPVYGPPYTHLFTHFFPMMVQRGVEESVLYGLLDRNTRRFFAGEGPATRSAG